MRRVFLLLGYQLAAALVLFAAIELTARWAINRIPPAVVDSGAAHPPCFNNPGVVTSPRAFGYRLKYHINKVGLRGPNLPLHFLV